MRNNEFNRSFGIMVRHYRRELNWTQNDLAKHSGYSRSFIAQIETGKTAVTFDTGLAFMNVLQFSNADISELMHKAKLLDRDKARTVDRIII